MEGGSLLWKLSPELRSRIFEYCVPDDIYPWKTNDGAVICEDTNLLGLVTVFPQLEYEIFKSVCSRSILIFSPTSTVPENGLQLAARTLARIPWTWRGHVRLMLCSLRRINVAHFVADLVEMLRLYVDCSPVRLLEDLVLTAKRTTAQGDHFIGIFGIVGLELSIEFTTHAVKASQVHHVNLALEKMRKPPPGPGGWLKILPPELRRLVYLHLLPSKFMAVQRSDRVKRRSAGLRSNWLMVNRLFARELAQVAYSSVPIVFVLFREREISVPKWFQAIGPENASNIGVAIISLTLNPSRMHLSGVVTDWQGMFHHLMFHHLLDSLDRLCGFEIDGTAVKHSDVEADMQLEGDMQKRLLRGEKALKMTVATAPSKTLIIYLSYWVGTLAQDHQVESEIFDRSVTQLLEVLRIGKWRALDKKPE